MLKQRIITALILVVLLLAALFYLPPLGWSLLVLAVVLVGVAEWGRLAQLSKNAANAYWWLTLIVMAGLLWLDVKHSDYVRTAHLAAYIASAFLWLIVVPLWLFASVRTRQPLLLALVGWAVLIPTGLAMIDLRAASPWALLGVMALVWMADIAAYFAGRKFGKHKLAPTISPGKSWEGVAGAVVGVSLYVVLAAWGSGLYKTYAIFPTLVVASWLWVALSVVGDLFESAIKRQAGVKDSGTLLPGHGGLLDRIDALTSTLPLAALVLVLQRTL
jgi:phosphatidate cytidylyltransferase